MSAKKQSSTRTAGIAGWLVVAIAILFPVLGSFASVWTDYQWYDSLGQTAVFWTRINSQAILFGLSAFLTFALLLVTAWVAFKQAPGWSGMPSSGSTSTDQTKATIIDSPFGPQTAYDLGDIKNSVGKFADGLQPFVKRLVPIVAAVLAVLVGMNSMANWETMRLALARVPFGVVDPQFHMDAGFYVFWLPAIEHISAWANTVVVLAIVFTAVVYFLRGGITPWSSKEKFAPHVKAHLSVLLSLFVLLRGVAYVVNCYELNFSSRGQVVGASYTDVHAQLPAYIILAVVSAITAIALLFNIVRKGWKLPAYALGSWLVISIVVGGIFPALMQQFIVQPNEASLEKPYINRNIDMTRKAYNLTDIEEKTFAASDSLTLDEVKKDAATVDNIRLWDPSIAQKSYEQLQAIRPYYDFADVDVDRYKVGDDMRQVLVSVREMNSSQLASTAQTWVNSHLIYTHGYGMVMTAASEYDTRGLPKFIIGDVPPKVDPAVKQPSPALDIKQPRVYYGEKTTDYVIVDTGIDEFDRPQGEKNATYRYEANSGVKVGGFFNRVAWALRLESAQMLVSSYIKSDSRILIRREVRQRVTELAPWLTLDGDLYPVLADGKIYWVIDGYTTSNKYPYSERLSDGTNYIRGSVKVTVDAFTGETTFYAFDNADPVLKAWRSVFPSLFKDASAVPAAVRDHFRYPKELFMAQAEIYRTYHMTDPSVFYNKEDQWETPGEKSGQPMEPFFVLLQLPGNPNQEFYMMQPFTPRNRDNMIGWMAVSSNPEDYGKRTVYLFPKDRVILGPDQISARINQDAVISPQLSLWNQRGSTVMFGNMVVIPINNSIVYIQPLFLQAEKTAIPELTAVVVAYADKIVMDRDLKKALATVFGGSISSDGSSAGDGGTGSGTGTGDGTTSPGVDESKAQEAARLFTDAITAQRAGDWKTYGEKMDAVGKLLAELAVKK